MKGLRKYLTPFAPDQSGAASVLYDLGGILVICDAGGCAGNICGFDEPRWSTQRSAVFSAGLRDMDAILGRDDRLIQKLTDVSRRIDANFAAVIGTPVPAVIGTDFQALCRMAARRLDMPVFCVASNGMELYDRGAQEAYLEMFRALTRDAAGKDPARIGVLGAIPLELGNLTDSDNIAKCLREEGWEQVVMYGMGAAFEDVRSAGCSARNLVVSPSGLKAAEYLRERFGTPFEIRYPMADWPLRGEDLSGKKILIVHQHVYASSLRQRYLIQGAAEVCLASWFEMIPDLLEPDRDRHLVEEDDLIGLVRDHAFDIVVADETMEPMLPFFRGRFVSAPHFAVSGKQVCV